MERRLAAVMIADVVGYSRLSEVDEEGTRARFRADVHEVFEPKIEEHHGRLVKTMGDGLLIEFQSVVDALRCAIDVQRGMAERNTGLLAEGTLAFRIGINLGDVIVEGNDIHGDGVNIADRLQGLAEPGGIAISGTAYDQVKAKLAVGFADLGAQHVKNVTEPVRVYKVLLDPVAAGKTLDASKKRQPKWRWSAVAAVLASLASLGMATAFWLWREDSPCLTRTIQPATEGPSIAVLPLDNLSGDPQQTDIVDGIADDLTTALWQIQGLFVIARNSAFAYRGKSCDMRRIAKELGVRDLIEGSVQRSGDTMRVNIQIIDGETGGHIWARTFDGSFADHLALQDRITQSIADALSLRVSSFR